MIVVAIICCFVTSNYALPQVGSNQDASCANLSAEGYLCVEKSKCFVKTCDSTAESLSAEVFGAPDSSIRSGDEPSAICSASTGSVRKRADCDEKIVTSIRQADNDSEKVCCHQEDVISDVIVDNSTKTCEDFEGFRCIPFHLCQHSDKITNLHSLNETTVTNRAAMVEIALTETKCQSSVEVCCNMTENDINSEPDVVKFTSKCGTHGKSGSGYDTEFGEWPHMCLVQRVRPNSKSRAKFYLAGGSLIAPGIVLTAAHWLYDLNADDIVVTCGEWDRNQETEPLPSQERKLKHISFHPGFNPKNVFNDVALLHVEEDFHLAEHINVICLPTAPVYDDFDKNSCIATGWGKDSEGDHSERQNLLQKVSLPFVDHDRCQELLKATKLGPNFALDQSFNCAGGKANEDTCKGDGGSPLVCPLNEDPDHYVQVGIVAWGLECGLPDVPGVYASVPHALCFIKMATFCKEGSRFDKFFTVEGCEKWFDEEIEAWTEKKTGYELIMNNEKNPIDIRERFKDNFEYAVRTVNNIENMARSCSSRS